MGGCKMFYHPIPDVAEYGEGARAPAPAYLFCAPRWGDCVFNWQIMNPEVQTTSPLDLADVVMTTPAAGLVKMRALVFLGVVLICLACGGARLPWVLYKVAASVERQFGLSAMYGKSNRAADSLCKHLFALAHSVIEESEVLGVEFAGDEVGEVANLNRYLTKRADDEAGDAPRVVGVHLCLDGPRNVRVRAGFCVELLGSVVVVFVYLVRALLDGCTEGHGCRL